MNILQRAKKLWQLTEDFQGVVSQNGSEDQKMSSEPFVTFPCAECKQNIMLKEHLYPGQVAVLVCQNCATSMSVYNPILHICKTQDLPEAVGKPIWNELSTNG